MATKAYLSSQEFETGRKLFLSDEFESLNIRTEKCSQWLSERLLARLSAMAGWEASQPIRLGSWARGELCPKSDVDLLFVGDEVAVAKLVKRAQSEGIKIRSRTPADKSDWSVGVEPFDILALFAARAFDAESAYLLEKQIDQLKTQKALKRSILSAIRRERRERQRRYDSVSNYLEPQLKYGAGGLRDLEQALVMREFSFHSFSDGAAFAKITEAKKFLLGLRQLAHWLGGSDVLAGSFQPEIARILGFQNLSELMKQVQIRLERGSFYADWVVEQVANKKAIKSEIRDLKPDAIVQLFTKDSSLSNQYMVRVRSRKIWAGVQDVEKGEVLQSIFSKLRSDDFWVALARSLFLEDCVTDLKKVKGLTQHDHYHRYTVETHLYQALRETDRLCAKPKNLFSLRSVVKDLKSVDWAILRWTALFHDLGKGREQDHSSVGEELVRTRLGKMGLPEVFVEEVAWMVKNHLILTTAAFRQNANQSSTWKRLFERGVVGSRVARLMVFSAIDIRATNPEAWNSWKAQLLADLFSKLRSEAAVRHQKFFDHLKRSKVLIPADVVTEIDPFIIESLPPSQLIKDLKAVVATEKDLPVWIRKHNSKQAWVRMHRFTDRPGLLLEFVQKLFWAGARIDAACVMTLKGKGVYDWFLVRTSRTPKELLSRLNQGVEAVVVHPPEVLFQNVDLVSEDENGWVLSFRGRDQKGLLLAAAQALFDQNLTIQWARVHTWGGQIDDVFCVEANGDLQNHLSLLRKKFVT
jgi:[protein-PII] uridylyltransferase